MTYPRPDCSSNNQELEQSPLTVSGEFHATARCGNVKLKRRYSIVFVRIFFSLLTKITSLNSFVDHKSLIYLLKKGFTFLRSKK